MTRKYRALGAKAGGDYLRFWIGEHETYDDLILKITRLNQIGVSAPLYNAKLNRPLIAAADNDITGVPVVLRGHPSTVALLRKLGATQ